MTTEIESRHMVIVTPLKLKFCLLGLTKMDISNVHKHSSCRTYQTEDEAYAKGKQELHMIKN